MVFEDGANLSCVRRLRVLLWLLLLFVGSGLFRSGIALENRSKHLRTGSRLVLTHFRRVLQDRSRFVSDVTLARLLEDGVRHFLVDDVIGRALLEDGGVLSVFITIVVLEDGSERVGLTSLCRFENGFGGLTGGTLRLFDSTELLPH